MTTRKSAAGSSSSTTTHHTSSIDPNIIRALYPPSRGNAPNMMAAANSSSGSLSSGGGVGGGSGGGVEEGRFTQLLLEHGERHLQDWAVLASSSPSSSGTDSTRRSPSCSMKRLEGRLRLCSRSIVWEPSDMSRGIVRCPFGKLEGEPSLVSEKEVEIVTVRHLVIKVNNRIEPFCTIDLPVRFQFQFRHSTPQPFLELCKTVHDLATQEGSNNTTAEAALDALLRPMLDRPLDPSSFVSLREVPQTPHFKCSILVPLMRKPGVCVVTSERLYFQPANAGVFTKIPTRAQHWHLQDDVVAVARRYDGLRDCALEVYLPSSSVLISLEGSGGGGRGGWREREEVLYWLVHQHHKPCLTDRSFVQLAMTEWCRGALSNFDYLLVLNAAAGRSFQDLSRYPVFPWVLADYESSQLDFTLESTFRDFTKPVGALDASRLESFRRRMESMSDLDGTEPFLYGTHFSAPGYVLFFLVRCMPEHMLCLQNGKFDHPDRLFHSMRHCWHSVLKNPADVKELIPEFYFPQGGFDFLVNAMGLNLGNTQRGDRVYDVGLPPWAKSPRDFLRKQRKALESEWCTARLPRWMDLIFGCTSRGNAALEADNVFAPTAYLGPSDWEALADQPEARLQAELQANEFGIHPDVLFQQPHPSRGDSFLATKTVLAPETPGRAMNPQERAAAGATTTTNGPLVEPLMEGAVVSLGGEQEGHGPPSFSPFRSTAVATKASPMAPPPNGRSRSQSDAQNWEFLEEPPNANDGSASSFVDLVPPDKRSTNPFAVNGSHQHHNSNNSNNNNNNKKKKNDWRLENGKPRLSLSGSGDRLHTSGSAAGFVASSSSSSTSAWSTSHAATTPSRRTTSNAVATPPPAAAAAAASASSPLATQSPEWTIRPLAPRLTPHGDSVTGCWLYLAPEDDNDDEDDDDNDKTKNPSLVTTVSLDGQLMVHTLPPMTDNNGQEEQRRTFEDERSAFMSRLPYLGALSSGGGGGNNGSDLGGDLSSMLYGTTTSSSSSLPKLTLLRSHAASEPLACVQVVPDPFGGLVAFAGGHDDVVVAFGIHSACALASLYSHRDAVTGIHLLPKTPEQTEWLLVTGSWDGTCKVWLVSLARGETVSMMREPLLELWDAESSLLNVAATWTTACSKTRRKERSLLIAAACADGTLLLWACQVPCGEKQLLLKEEARRGSGECTSVEWGTDGDGDTKSLFVGYASGRVSSFLYSNGTIRPTSRVSLGSAVNCLATAPSMVLAGCANGNLCVLPVSEGAYLDVNPTVWKCANHCGITSLSLAARGDQKWVCATGGEDGSVGVQEMQRRRQRQE